MDAQYSQNHQALMDAFIAKGMNRLSANTLAACILDGTMNQRAVDALADALKK